MAALGTNRVYPLPEGEAVDVLAGFEPGTYLVRIRPQGTVYIGGPDVDPSSGWLISEQAVEVVAPGQLFILRPSGGDPAGFTILAVPYVGQKV